LNNRTQLRASLLLAAVLVAGIVLGWFGNERFDQPRRDRGRNTERLVERLTKDLALTATQRDSVRVVLERRRADIDSLWSEVHPRIDTLRAATYAEVEMVLTPEQRRVYREQVAQEKRERLERRAERRR
jgi:hypothetical protein